MCGEDHKLWSFTLAVFTKYFPKHPVLKHPPPTAVVPLTSDKVSYPYKTADKIT
jgi:hypothetical protein